mmetsp:Transcript_36992/g.115857  ORF Transcript_36992/g.115857 Transcript_36992/m.115857 type:complete len:325 (-) Transcript_36992:940-1914(-)
MPPPLQSRRLEAIRALPPAADLESGADALEVDVLAIGLDVVASQATVLEAHHAPPAGVLAPEEASDVALDDLRGGDLREDLLDLRPAAAPDQHKLPQPLQGKRGVLLPALLREHPRGRDPAERVLEHHRVLVAPLIHFLPLPEAAPALSPQARQDVVVVVEARPPAPVNGCDLGHRLDLRLSLELRERSHPLLPAALERLQDDAIQSAREHPDGALRRAVYHQGCAGAARRGHRRVPELRAQLGLLRLLQRLEPALHLHQLVQREELRSLLDLLRHRGLELLFARRERPQLLLHLPPAPLVDALYAAHLRGRLGLDVLGDRHHR